MNRWNGKVAVVTGASSGIGLCIAEHLAICGLKVVGIARRKEKLDDLAKNLKEKNGKFYPVKCDVTKEEDILNAFKWITDNVGIVAVLINNAGIGNTGTLFNGETFKWKNVLDTNLLGLCIATREAIKIMGANKVNGHIVNINSLAGHYVPNLSHMNIYPASKHGVTALTETFRQELNSLGSKIKITSISPGVVKTDIAKTSGCSEVSVKAWHTMPFLLPDDIAHAVLYVLGTPPHVQVHELIIKPSGEIL